ncbi:MAG: helix-turn-helix domain-containing protein, partial [Mycobacteriales bacterium]
LSQRDLARRAEVSQSMIARIEARRVDPPVGLVQRLLACCGMRWDLRLAPCCATPRRAATGVARVRASAARRADAAGGRRMMENAAARQAADSLVDSLLSVRERRSEIRLARLAERARQAAAYAALINSDDNATRAWVRGDESACRRLFEASVQNLSVPPIAQLPERIAGHLGQVEIDVVRSLFEQMSLQWAHPALAVTGVTARALWSSLPQRHHGVDVVVAPMRGHGAAIALLMKSGAAPRPGGTLFELAGVRVRVRLRARPPVAASLVRWRPDGPFKALAVDRPEWLADAAVDRHAIRAVLATAHRDGRGRRLPPYHESFGIAVRPRVFEPGCQALADSDLRDPRTIVRP